MRKKLYAVHGWLGYHFGLLLFVVCFSGSMAVVSNEIDWLLTPAKRVAPGPQTFDWTAMVDRVREVHPDARIVSLHTNGSARSAVEFIVENAEDTTERIYVDPYRGEVTGRLPWFNCQRFFRDFHRRFFVFAWWGIWVVCFFAIVLLLSLSTGLMIYKRWWAKFFTFRGSRSLKAFVSDFHRLVGVWTVLFAGLISLTGIWYMLEIPLGWSHRSELDADTGLTSAGQKLAEEGRPRLPATQWVESAMQAKPALQLRTITFPTEPDDIVKIDGQESAWFVRDRANYVDIDPYTGDVLANAAAERAGWVERWIDTADPLHFGSFGGLATKLLWLVFGLALSTAMPTGAYLWVWRRLQIAKADIAKRARQQQQRDGQEINVLDDRRVAGRTAPSPVVGLLSTAAVWLLAAYATWTAVSQELQANRDTYGWSALGSPAHAAVYAGFLLVITLVALLWLRFVWLARSLPSWTAAGS